MRPWKTLIGAMMLVLMLWAGGLAHAAERVDCIPATAETAGHYEGDDDQLPSDRDQGVAHHHAGCSGHQLAAPAGQPAIILNHSTATVPLARSEAGLHDHDPDGQLRPPIRGFVAIVRSPTIMKSIAAAAGAVAVVAASSGPADAQVGNPATPQVGRPQSAPAVGPPAPPEVLPAIPRSGPLPANLTLAQALEEAAARSPAVVAAEREVAAAEARVRQAGYRENPELSLEVENVAGTGELRGLSRMETTVAVNQRLDLGGRRGARVGVARAELAVQRLRLAIARADLAQSVREQFARAVSARERLEQARDNVAWAQELARIAGLLVEAGRDPPLRAVRARSALAQARAALEAAEAEEMAARSSLAALFGVSSPVGGVTGSSLDLTPRPVAPETSLEVLLADAERAAAEAGLRQQLAGRRLDPAVGAGVRHVRETGDFGFVAGLSMPLQIFDRNQGNIAAARAAAAAADARRAGTLASTTAKARNAIANVEAAQRRVSALEGSAIPEAAEALRLTQRSYEEGRASLLELLDARNAYTAAQAQLTEARLALALATAELGRISAQQEQSR